MPLGVGMVGKKKKMFKYILFLIMVYTSLKYKSHYRHLYHPISIIQIKLYTILQQPHIYFMLFNISYNKSKNDSH
jgi:hypothetical protein